MKDPFFINKLSFHEGDLHVALQRQGRQWAEVLFEVPRAFRFFNESDNFSYLANFEGQNLLDTGSGCCISESRTAPYLNEYLRSTPEARLEDGLRSIIIVTPQECVEVVSFESPSIEILEAG